MANKNLKELIRKRAKLIAEMEKLSQLLHGSWVKRYSVCSRPGCKCHQGKRHGPRYYLVINEKGRQRQKYISNSLVQTALTGLAQYRRLQEIVDKLTLINMKMMKEAERESQ